MPFIQPRLSSKTVEDIWTQAGSDKHPQEGCTRCWCGSKYWDGDICHSCGEKWDGHDSTDDWESQRAPHTAKAKVFKSHDGKSWGVACNTNECRSVRAMEGLTHDGASQLADSHNKAHHSKTASDGFTSNPHYEGWDGKDPMATTPKPGPDCNCERCVNDPYSPRNRARTAFTHDEIDWTDIEPGSPECASYRPSDLEETRRMVRREDDRRKTPRDTPDRRQAANDGRGPAQSFDPNGKWCEGIGETPNSRGGCARCYLENAELSDGGYVKRHNPVLIDGSVLSSRKIAIDTMTGKRSDDPLYAHGAGENSKLFRVDYTHREYPTGNQIPATLYIKAFNAFDAEVKGRSHGRDYLMHIIGTDPKATEVPEGQQSFFSRRKTAVENWDAIMQSPELKAVWPQVRNLASEIASARMPKGDDGEAIYGLSSSDINHTVFGYAQRYWNGSRLDVAGMVREMMDEADQGW